MSDPTPTPLTDAERQALWTVWESDATDDAELAGLFFATVAVLAHARVAAAWDEGWRTAQLGVDSLVAAARADERERLMTRFMDAAPRLNMELRHDGSSDPEAAAYVEGWHDAWAALAQPADTESGDA